MKGNRPFVVLICVLLGATAITSATQTSSAQPGPGWAYAELIAIQENSGDNLADYQTPVELDSTNFDFSKANPDGSDVRFYAGSEELSYWIEEWDPVVELAKIWVKVPSMPANSDTTIKMYYGNPGATSTSDGDATFMFFDDFEGTSLDSSKWDAHVSSGGSITVSDGKVRLASPDTWGDNTAIISKSTFDVNTAWGYTLSEQHQHSVYKGLSFPIGPWDTAYWRLIGKQGTDYPPYPAYHHRTSRGNGGNRHITDKIYSDDVYYGDTEVGVSLKRDQSGDVVHDYWDSQGYALDWGVFGPDIALPTTFAFFSHCNEGYSGWLDVDNVFVRKYASPQPTVTLRPMLVAVGGMVEMRVHGSGAAVDSAAGSSDGSPFPYEIALAAGVAAGAIAVAAGALYTRRRWLR